MPLCAGGWFRAARYIPAMRPRISPPQTRLLIKSPRMAAFSIPAHAPAARRAGASSEREARSAGFAPVRAMAR
jgi:hypothetical protein